MVLDQGEKLHVITRRNFDSDIRRHFLGEVISLNGIIARASGYVFVLDNNTGQFVRRIEKRTRIIGLADAGNIINVLPREADIENCEYVQSGDGRLVITDGKSFKLDINEFGSSR